MKLVRYDDNLYLSKNVSKLFYDHQYDLLYLKDYDLLFAISTISYPNQDSPYIQFKGFNCNTFREIEDVSEQLKNLFNKKIKEEETSYYISTKEWLVIKNN